MMIKAAPLRFLKAMERYLIFGILSIPVILLSLRGLSRLKSHGFYRFFSWECIIFIFAANYKYWFVNPASFLQIVSWICLILSAYLVTAGVIKLKKAGKPGRGREDHSLFRFERTSELVQEGIYKYIRHPLYSSLLFLTWGIYMKNTTLLLLVPAILSTLFLFLTARFDERECIEFFGEKYKSLYAEKQAVHSVYYLNVK